jgi:hypothetical protein
MRNAELRSALHKLGALRMLAAASAAMFHAAHRLLVLRLLLAAIRVLAEPARNGRRRVVVAVGKDWSGVVVNGRGDECIGVMSSTFS